MRGDTQGLGDTKRPNRPSKAMLLVLGVLCAVYGTVVGVVGNQKVSLVLLVLPLVLGLAVFPKATQILLFLLVATLSFSARFRLLGQEFRPGGAELALAPLDFILILLALPVLVQIVKRPDFFKTAVRPLLWPFLIFFSAHLISFADTTDPGLTAVEVLRLGKMAFFVLLLIYYVSSRTRLRFILQVVMLIIIVQCALAILQSVFRVSYGLDFLGEHQFWTIGDGSETIGRAGGTLGHANVLANFFEVLTPLALALVLSGVRGRLYWLAALALPAGLIGTFLSFSRAGWVALIIGLLVCVFSYRRHLQLRRLIPGLWGMAIVGGILGVFFRNAFIQRLTLFWEGSKTVRQITAETAVNMIRAHPLIGVGANNYRLVSPNYTGSVTLGLTETAAGIAHNILLLYAAELGLVGLTALFILLLAIWRLTSSIIRSEDAFVTAVAAGLWAGIVALLAHGMWDWLLRYDPVFTLFWFSVGLLAATMNILNIEKRIDYAGTG